MIFRDDLFKNKSVLVTGGGTGIGKEIAAQFLKAGATVFICGRKEAKLKAAIEELSLLGTCFEKTTDIRETAQILDLANFIKEKTGRLDILINNAGGQFLSPAEDITEKGWLAVINNNLIVVYVTICVIHVAKLIDSDVSSLMLWASSITNNAPS